jgi:hypothetical protein
VGDLLAAVLVQGAAADDHRGAGDRRVRVNFTVNTPDAGRDSRALSLMRPGAVTHGFDQDQRILSLAFTVGSGSIAVQAPADARLAPPGYTCWFLVNAAGVPSVAPFVQVPPAGVERRARESPANLRVVASVGTATLTWYASTDNRGVVLYRIYRSTVSGFTPGSATLAGTSTSATFTNGNLPSNTILQGDAVDAAGNVSAASTEAAVLVPADTTPPTYP